MKNDPTARSSGSTVALLGFKRIDEICMIIDECGTMAEATGVTHRYSRTIRIPLGAAQVLIEAGVPRRLEIRRTSSPVR